MTGKPGESGPRGDDRLVGLLAEHLRRVAEARSRDERRRALDALADAIGDGDALGPIVARFVGGDPNEQRFVLELVSRLAVPEAVLPSVLPLLSNRRLSVSLRLRAADRLLRSLPPFQPASNQVLQAVIARATPRKAFQRLQLLRARLPDYTSLNQLYDELAANLMMACPRCGVRLERAEMVTHLWREHRLVLEAGQVREPWKLIEQWLRDYARSGRPALLGKALELAQQIDPQGGVLTVHRHLLAMGLTDDEAGAHLRRHAADTHGTLCPHCFAVVPDPTPDAPELMVTRGCVAGNGYEVRVEDGGLTSRLTVATPDDLVYRGSEPGRRWTLRGAILLQVGPFVLAALAVAVGLPPHLMAPITPVSLLLLVALLGYIRSRLALDPGGNATERAVDHAWRHLGPRLCRPMFSTRDATFAAGLARISLSVGSPAVREPSLERIGKVTRAAVADGSAAPSLLAVLMRLELEDATAADRDRILLLAQQVGPCLSGALPVRFADELLASCGVDQLAQGDRARLRVLLLTRAFEEGLDPLELQELGRAYPFLGQAYASEDLNGLTRLRWLALVKPQRPWRRFGPATAVLDLARYPTLGSQYLSLRPDLLLFQPMGDVAGDEPSSAPILVCEEGVLYRDVLIDDPDTRIRVQTRSLFQGGGYALHIGAQTLTFRQDPSRLRRRLEGWVRYLFQELLPQARRAQARRSGRVEALLSQKVLACPECGERFLAMRGEVGIPWDEQDERLAEPAAS